jgi:hypothetical protein
LILHGQVRNFAKALSKKTIFIIDIEPMKITKNLILLIPVLIWLAGCGKKEMFKPSLIEEIRLEENIPIQTTSKAKLITDREVIKKFIDAINSSEPETLKFEAKWRILLTDEKRDIHLIFCTKDAFKYKGQTYKAEEDLEKILMP